MPAWEAWEFQAVLPPGTDPTAPTRVPTPLPARRVHAIRWRIPAGPLGFMGWMITMGGTPVLPRPPGTFMVTDGHSGEWSLDGLPDSGAFEVTGYNLGAFPHTVYVTYMASPLIRAVYPGASVTAAQLAEAPDLSHAGPPLPPRYT